MLRGCCEITYNDSLLTKWVIRGHCEVTCTNSSLLQWVRDDTVRLLMLTYHSHSEWGMPLWDYSYWLITLREWAEAAHKDSSPFWGRFKQFYIRQWGIYLFGNMSHWIDFLPHSPICTSYPSVKWVRDFDRVMSHSVILLGYKWPTQWKWRQHNALFSFFGQELKWAQNINVGNIGKPAFFLQTKYSSMV